MTLNNTQKSLVEDNHDLIYSYLEYRNLSLDAPEDWYGAAAIGLCKAAIMYSGNGEYDFSHIAYPYMENEILEIIKEHSNNASPTFYLDEQLGGNQDCLYLDDIISNQEDCFTTSRIKGANSAAQRFADGFNVEKS